MSNLIRRPQRGVHQGPPVGRRSIAFGSGARIPGPAIIVEDETSTVVTRLFTATIDPFGYINLNRRAC
jgi:hypothetical protein